MDKKEPRRIITEDETIPPSDLDLTLPNVDQSQVLVTPTEFLFLNKTQRLQAKMLL